MTLQNVCLRTSRGYAPDYLCPYVSVTVINISLAFLNHLYIMYLIQPLPIVSWMSTSTL